MIGECVFIKFGEHHGKVATIIDYAEKQGLPAYKLWVSSGENITKKQKNTIRLVK